MKKLTTFIVLFTLAAMVVTLCATPSAPTITSFSPSSGPVGTLVTITGTNLNSPTGCAVGGTTALVISGSSTAIVAYVMPGSSTGSVSVTTADGTTSSVGNFTVTATSYPSGQQGSKLVGTGGESSEQGSSVSISADGNTAIVGGHYADGGVGAAWVYTRIGNTWTQQGDRLVGTGNDGASSQGESVSLSADGNTAIVGGKYDNSSQGAAWVFTRSGSTWTQQEAKLVGTGSSGAARQGYSVSLSADGNTAIVGGRDDNGGVGAAWVFTRSGSTWTQQGAKLVGTGFAGAAQQGHSVSLSADGNTAIVGGYDDNVSAGAAWVYTRSGVTWTQQGDKLVGTAAIGTTYQGISVSLSADGNTAMVGGYYDNSGVGAAWVFTRITGTWWQQAKLVGTGNVGASNQGISVSLSADGNVAVIGGAYDNNYKGAVWVFTRNGASWSQHGNKLVGTGSVGNASQAYSISLSANGNTAIAGGAGDNGGVGAAWVFASAELLPVELTSFTAEIAEKSVELKWRTATEVNNYGFEIERAMDNETSSSLVSARDDNWSKIGFVEGNGTTNAPKSYSFTDKSASGKISYRLKQIDRDGKFEYSQTVEVTAANTPKEFGLEQNYPNPFNPTTAIGYQLSANGFTSLKVYDAIGREVATLVNEAKDAGYYSAQFDGTKLSSGIYFYKLISGNYVGVKKLVLLK